MDDTHFPDLSSIARDPASGMAQQGQGASPCLDLPTYYPGMNRALDPTPLTEQEVVEARGITMLLERYRSEFPGAAGPILGGKDLAKLPPKTAQALLGEVRMAVANKNMGTINQFGAQTALELLEGFMLTSTSIKCKGLGQLGRDPAFMDIIKEMSLESTNLIYVAPQYRAAFHILRTIYFLHQTNSEMEALAERQKAQPASAASNAGPDLEKADRDFDQLMDEAEKTS